MESIAVQKQQNDSTRRLVKPRPAGARPQKHKMFPWLNLLKVPKRLLCPPQVRDVGSVRSFSRTPLALIKIEDVIANKYLPPLSLRDFEGYLVYREMSAELLYFILWLVEYRKEWTQAKKSGASFSPKLDTELPPGAPAYLAKLPERLAFSLARGVESFLKPDAPLELNLPQDMRDRTLSKVESTGDPNDFEEVREHVMELLGHSLQKYTKMCVGNAGTRRKIFALCLGISLFLVGLVPPFVGIFGDYARGYRAIGIPFFFLGAMIAAMAVKGMCALIWLLGEDRQLLPWEMRPSTINSGSIVPMSSASSIHSFDSDSTTPSESAGSSATAASANPYPWEQQLSEKEHEKEMSSASSTDYPSTVAPSSPQTYRSKGRITLNSMPTSAPIFGPVTDLEAPEIKRIQWEGAIIALIFGTIVTCIVGAVLLAVPNA